MIICGPIGPPSTRQANRFELCTRNPLLFQFEFKPDSTGHKVHGQKGRDESDIEVFHDFLLLIVDSISRDYREPFMKGIDAGF